MTYFEILSSIHLFVSTLWEELLQDSPKGTHFRGAFPKNRYGYHNSSLSKWGGRKTLFLWDSAECLEDRGKILKTTHTDMGDVPYMEVSWEKITDRLLLVKLIMDDEPPMIFTCRKSRLRMTRF